MTTTTTMNNDNNTNGKMKISSGNQCISFGCNLNENHAKHLRDSYVVPLFLSRAPFHSFLLAVAVSAQTFFSALSAGVVV